MLVLLVWYLSRKKMREKQDVRMSLSMNGVGKWGKMWVFNRTIPLDQMAKKESETHCHCPDKMVV